MAAATHNLTIEQGATFMLNLVYKDSTGTPINLSGYSARMQIRRAYTSPSSLATFSTENGRIALGTVSGTIEVTGDAALTSALAAKTAVYDLELVSPVGAVTRLIRGTVTITPEVTK